MPSVVISQFTYTLYTDSCYAATSLGNPTDNEKVSPQVHGDPNDIIEITSDRALSGDEIKDEFYYRFPQLGNTQLYAMGNGNAFVELTSNVLDDSVCDYNVEFESGAGKCSYYLALVGVRGELTNETELTFQQVRL
ncbi:hypothetical protein IWW51_006447 [Coemansia sp. RSA 2702]|nr:hypothetical protein IWW51_006447 [Coemansia sp. RSA 2702]KAJ2317813.1 hypothetical protein IWW52_002918 [Coemansia sp. RSA 2704]